MGCGCGEKSEEGERGGWGKESLGWRKKSEEREKVERGRGAWEQEGEVRGWCDVVC